MPKYKMAFFGDNEVGKTSLFNYFSKGELSESYTQTKNINKTVKINLIKDLIDFKEKKFKLYDTPGDWSVMKFATNSFMHQDCFLLMYDITKEKSFENIKKRWLPLANKAYSLRHHLSEKENGPVILIGNKFDANKRRQVKKEYVEQFARENKIAFIEISVQSHINIGNLTSKISEILERDKNYFCCCQYKNIILIEFNIKYNKINKSFNELIIK